MSTVDHQLRRLLHAINQRMHKGSTCPGAGSLGECAAISDLIGESGHKFHVASLYLWPAAVDLNPATVAAWFIEAGCTEVVVSAILHDPDNDTINGLSGGARPWEVSFLLKEPRTVPPIRMPLTLVDNEDNAGRIPGQPGYMGPGQ
jgi:hypothetical protein